MSRDPIPVIINPAAGGGRLLRAKPSMEASASAVGRTLIWWSTSAPGDGESLARRAVADGRPLVLAYGGDGTYNEVARGLIGSSTAMGVVPGGTTSVLAYELAIPRRPERAVSALLGGRDRAMHAGRTDRGDLFLLMLSAGPDSLVLARFVPLLKRLGGRVGIALQAVVELLRPQPMPRLGASCGELSTACGWVIVGNSRCYGGPQHATPGADPFAAELEVVLQRRAGRRAAAGFAIGLFVSGRHVQRTDVWRGVVPRVRIDNADSGARLRYQVDGDIAGELPVEAWIDPDTLMVRVPSPDPSAT